MIECDFHRMDDATVRCQRCERELASADGIELGRIHARCRTRCQYLGELIGALKVDCECGARRQAVHECCEMGRCLPNLRLHGEHLQAWLDRKPESDIYQACTLCPRFTAAV